MTLKKCMLLFWFFLLAISVVVFIFELKLIKEEAFDRGYEQAYSMKGRLIKNVTIIMGPKAEVGITINEKTGVHIKDCTIIGGGGD